MNSMSLLKCLCCLKNNNKQQNWSPSHGHVTSKQEQNQNKLYRLQTNNSVGEEQ